MRATLRTAGERVELDCAIGWLAQVLAEGAAGQLAPLDDTPPDVRITVEEGRGAFGPAGFRLLTRGTWCRPGQVIMRDACASGLDLLVTAADPTLDVVARWRPPVTGRAASVLLRARATLLLRAVLLQYPALWRAQQRGRVPLHASVCTIGSADGITVLLAGPGGVGKSTLVHAELVRGALGTCDNVCVSDGRSAWGVVEPLRLPVRRHDRRGRRMPHGRRELPWPGRADRLTPARLAVLVRGSGGAPVVAPCDPAEAARTLTAGTYMAGELRRYWAFAAALALGTGVGAPHPPIEAVSAALTRGTDCVKVALGDRSGAPLRDLLIAGADAEVSR